MTCNTCGHESKDDDVFCVKCGAPLTPHEQLAQTQHTDSQGHSSAANTAANVVRTAKVNLVKPDAVPKDRPIPETPSLDQNSPLVSQQHQTAEKSTSLPGREPDTSTLRETMDKSRRRVALGRGLWLVGLLAIAIGLSLWPVQEVNYIETLKTMPLETVDGAAATIGAVFDKYLENAQWSEADTEGDAHVVTVSGVILDTNERLTMKWRLTRVPDTDDMYAAEATAATVDGTALSDEDIELFLAYLVDCYVQGVEHPFDVPDEETGTGPDGGDAEQTAQQVLTSPTPAVSPVATPLSSATPTEAKPTGTPTPDYKVPTQAAAQQRMTEWLGENDIDILLQYLDETANAFRFRLTDEYELADTFEVDKIDGTIWWIVDGIRQPADEWIQTWAAYKTDHTLDRDALMQAGEVRVALVEADGHGNYGTWLLLYEDNTFVMQTNELESMGEVYGYYYTEDWGYVFYPTMEYAFGVESNAEPFQLQYLGDGEALGYVGPNQFGAPNEQTVYVPVDY